MVTTSLPTQAWRSFVIKDCNLYLANMRFLHRVFNIFSLVFTFFLKRKKVAFWGRTFAPRFRKNGEGFS